MKKPIRILIVEDKPDDVDLARYEIRKTWNDCEFQVVETHESFIQALECFQPDAILSDHTLPHFDGKRALQLTLEHAPLTPLIIWTDSTSEDAAVDCMKAGANNYILKDNLKRLGPAVVHALEERQLLIARKDAEEEAKERERQLGILLNNLPGPVYRCRNDADFTMEFISDGIEELSGYPAEDFRNHRQHFGTLIHPHDRERVWMEIQTAVAQNKPFELTYCIVTAAGQEKWVWEKGQGILDDKGQLQALEGFITDVTIRKQAEESLQNNERRFRALIENGLDDISLLAADGTLLWESPSTVRNLGYAPNEFVGRNIFQIMHPDDLEWTRQMYAKLLQEPGDRQHGMFRLRRADGTWRWVQAIATNMLGEPAVDAIVINYRDVTEQKQAEIELQQKNTDLRLINSLNEAINRGEDLDSVVSLLRNELKHIFSSEYTNIYLLDQDGQSIKLHQSSIPPEIARKIEKLIGRTIPTIEIPVQEDGLFQSVLRSGKGMVTSDQKVVQKWIGEFVETASLPSIAKSVICKLLPQIYKILNIKSTILVPLISDTKALGVMNVSGPNNFTEQDLKRIENICGQLTIALHRKHVEEILKEERNLLRTLIDNVPDRIYAMDTEGRKTLSNIADWRASGGQTMEDVVGKTDFDLYPPEMAQEFWRLDHAVITSGEPAVNYEEPGFDVDGNRVLILTTKIPLHDETGNVTGLVGIGRDITERKQAETERQALFEIMQGLASTKDLQELLKLIHHTIANVIYAENFFVVLHQEKTGLFEEIYSVDQYDPSAPPSKLENSITSYVFRSGKPLLLSQALFDDLAAQDEVKLIGTNSASWLGVPLKTPGRIIGVMAVQDYENENRYSEHDKEFLVSIATQVALVIERKQAEEAVRESEEHYRAIFEGVQDAIFVESLDGKILMVNQRACEMFGYSREEFLTKTVDDLVPAGSPILLSDVIGDSLFVEPRETLNQRASGETFPIEISGRIHMINGEKVLLVVVRDITEHKQAEASLKVEREKAQKYLEIAGVMMLALDQDGRITLINQKGCKILGYSAEEIIGKNWINTCLPETNRDELHSAYQKLVSGETQPVGYFENIVINKAGEERLIAWHNTLVSDSEGNFVSTLSSGEDITERRQAEDQLRFEKERFDSIATTVPGIICSFRLRPDGSACMPFASPAIQDVYGFAPQDLQYDTTPLFARIHSEDLPRIMSAIAESGRTLLPWHSEFRYQHPSKGEIWIEGQSMPLQELDGSFIWHGFIHDVTERKQSEEEVQHRAEETSALLETSLALTNLDLEATLQTVGNSASTLFLADGCRIFLMEPDEETLRCVLALQENTVAFSDLKVRVGEGVTGAVAATGQAEIVNDMQNDPRAVQVTGTEEEQEAIMFAPLKDRTQTVGVISIRRLGKERPFQPADLELLEAFASIAASAVSKARLFQETQYQLAELHASEERFRQLADNIQEAFWITDAENGREIYMSPAIETIWQLPIHTMIDNPNAYINSVFPEDQPILLAAIEREKRGEKMQLEYRIRRPDGSLRWIWDRAFPVMDESGKVKRIAGISADITERKEAAEKLRESEDRYHSLFQNQLHGSALHEIVTNDQGQPMDYIFLKVNPAFEKMTGMKAQDLVGRRVTEVLSGIENERLIQIYGQVAQTGEPAHLHEYFAPLGRYYEINAYATGPRRLAVSFMDVTERRQAEQELRKLSHAVEQSGSAIVITNMAGNIEYVNPKFTQTTGYSEEEVLGKNPRILKSGFTADEEYKQLWQTITSGHEWHGELFNQKKDGTLFWEWVTISPILNERREITHFVGVKEDITERKQNEIETRRHILELEAVYENGLSVGRLLEPAEIGNRVIETFARYLRWHHVTIRLRKEGSDDLVLVAFNLPNLKEEERLDTEQNFVARINKVGHGLSGWVIQTGIPLRTGNVHLLPQYINTHAGIESGLYMPLKIGESVIGVISVESEAPDAFTEQDERLLATFANQTAVAFENARLYEAMQKELSERQRVEDALRASETHYRALADSITDILFELDQNLCYTHWNKASEALTGVPAANTIGKSMEEILGTTDEQARIRKIYEDVLSSHQPRTFETSLGFGEEKRSFEVNAYPSMRGVSVVATDVTDRKRTETIMQKRFELMEYSAKHSLQELMQKIVEEVIDLTGSEIGFFHFVEADQLTLGLQTWSVSAMVLFEAHALTVAHPSLDCEAVRQRRPLIQNNYRSPVQNEALSEHVSIAREMVIPIIRNERLLAVMGVCNKPKDYTPDDLNLATRLADYAWDITERKQMEAALETERNQLVQRVEERTADLSRANSNLARALRVKDEFLANMSHELRTPLNAILGLSESLGEQIAGPLNEKQQKYISTISESGHHLLSLINDILDLAKIDAGQITMDINKVEIHSVCQASLRMIKQLAQKKNQDVSLEIDNGLGLMWADERRLKQMIVNLLGNAVKFTPEYGKLGLEVHGDEDANQIAITVWDNGIGIKEEDLKRLFQPFVQLDSGLAREATGTGLGLALVAQMARLHGGSVNATSEAGKGSRFTITLPWEPALAVDTASGMRITGKFRAIKFDEMYKPTILIVEDTKEVVMMLKDYLELAGYKVSTAQDGMEGIVQARRLKPDVILMDIQMPRMDGFETTRKLRDDPNFRDIPIIALTALAMPHDRERCLEAGMDDYISKPVNLKALINIIQSCLLEKDFHAR